MTRESYEKTLQKGIEEKPRKFTEKGKRDLHEGEKQRLLR